MSGKDELFKHRHRAKEFQFDEHVADVFDDMLDRSIPFYRHVITMTGDLLRSRLRSGDHVVDLGCSTGTTLIFLAESLKDLELSFTGIDNSVPMLERARRKSEAFSKPHIRFQKRELQEWSGNGEGAVILNYTLQFIRPLDRPGVVKQIFDSLRPGGTLILSEKILLNEPEMNRVFIELYYDFKRTQGYSEMEIASKREALENVLIPFTPDENQELLKVAGFDTIQTFFQWFNFMSLIATKKEL